MHSIRLNIEDSIYEQSTLDFEEAKQKVKEALRSQKEYSEEETYLILENALHEA